jgi:hypothetical protein
MPSASVSPVAEPPKSSSPAPPSVSCETLSADIFCCRIQRLIPTLLRKMAVSSGLRLSPRKRRFLSAAAAARSFMVTCFHVLKSASSSSASSWCKLRPDPPKPSISITSAWLPCAPLAWIPLRPGVPLPGGGGVLKPAELASWASESARRYSFRKFEAAPCRRGLASG